jgi:TRAF3-interacting protein 1
MSKTIEDNKNVEAELEEKLRLVSAKPVENLITENLTNEEDDEFIVTDVIKSNEDDLDINQQLIFDNNNDLQKGSLVKQLIDTKKELEGNQSADVTTKDKNLTRLANRDIEKLRQSIQSLSQCANPLGKVLDYLQEDIDAMLSELKSWQEVYKQNMAILEKSRTSTDDDLESYKAELNLLDSDINEQLDKISVTKANLIRNEERLQKMVTMMNRSF